jgi:hypothetical protein
MGMMTQKKRTKSKPKTSRKMIVRTRMSRTKLKFLKENTNQRNQMIKTQLMKCHSLRISLELSNNFRITSIKPAIASESLRPTYQSIKRQ